MAVHGKKRSLRALGWRRPCDAQVDTQVRSLIGRLVAWLGRIWVLDTTRSAAAAVTLLV